MKTPSVLPDMGDVKTPAPPRLQKTDAPESDIVGPAISLPAKVKAGQAGPDLGKLPPIDRSILYWDQTAQGVIWTRGSTYKASFGPHGATYIPFLGAMAPRNYPVTFELASVSAGGKAVDFDPHVEAVRNGTVVSFEHGPVRLQYVMAIDSMEQLFVFDAPPAAGQGDLFIEMTVHSQMSKIQEDGRLALENDLGRVGYTQAIAIDAAGRREAVPTAWTAQGGISIRVPASYMAQAAYPLTIDPVINTVTVDTADADNRVPDVAYDESTDRWLVSYEDQFSATDGDVFAQTRTRTGGMVAGGGEFIDFTEDNWRNPKCANNNIANQFLVVAQRGDAPARVIVGRTRNASSITMGPQFVISSAAQSGDKFNPDVGGDPATTPPTHYCVVWERVFEAGTDNDIHARFVNANSTLVGGGTILVDNSVDTLDRNPSVSKSDGLAPFGTQRHTIVWQRRFEVGDEDIRAAQYLWDGSVVNSSFSVDFSKTTHQFPTVTSVLDATSGERDYMIVYTAGAAGSQSLVGRIMNGDVSQASANLTVLGGFTSGQNQILPSADSNGEGYAVAASELFKDSTTDYDVYISSFCRSGAAIRLAEGLQNLAFSVTTESQAQVCSTHSGGLLQSQEYYTVWRDAANVAAATLGDIESGRYDGLINDNETCPDALPIGTGTFFGSLRCAVDNGASSCGDAGGNPDVWYSFTAASHGTVTFSTCGTHDAPGQDDGMDTVLTLRNGCLLFSSELECNDDGIGDPCGGLDNGLIRDSFMQHDMLAGDTVFLRVSHFDTSIDDGEFRLNVGYATDPCAADFNNDGFINGIDLGILLNAFSIPPASPGCDGAGTCLPDLNGDGLVNGVDLGILLVNFSVPPGTPCN